MEGYMRKRSMLLLTGAVALVASLIVGPAATAKSERQAAGTVIIGHDQEPVTLNFYITEGNAYTTSLAMNPVLASASVYNQNAKLVPFLVAGAPKITRSNPLTVTFSYKPTAKWSDGRQITGADFMATYRTIMNPNFDITSREGWEDIQSIKVAGKKVTVTWKRGKAYAAWDALVATSPMPAHKVLGQNFNDLWRNSIDVASGPFKWQSWQRGTQMVLVKNNQFTAGPKAKVDRVVFRYIPSTPSLFQALNSGEIQVTEPQPQLQIVDIRKNTSKFKVQSGPGYFWEHMDIQFGPKGHAALKKQYVRQAIITGINRNQIKQALYVTPGLVGSAKDLPVLQSHIFNRYLDLTISDLTTACSCVAEVEWLNTLTGASSPREKDGRTHSPCQTRHQEVPLLPDRRDRLAEPPRWSIRGKARGLQPRRVAQDIPDRAFALRILDLQGRTSVRHPGQATEAVRGERAEPELIARWLA
jgi:ABC-type transport system substrate-binding protein